MFSNKVLAGGVTVATAFWLMAAGCSSDDGGIVYENTNWKEGATFPEDTTPMAVESYRDGAYYIAGMENRTLNEEAFAVVYRFRDGKLDLAFRSPDNHATFWCAGSSGETFWAGGYRHLENGDAEPYLVQYDGSAWTEIPPPAGLKGTVRACAPVSHNAGWVFTGYGDSHALYYVENGSWRETFPGAPEDADDVELAVTADGTAYLYLDLPGVPEETAHHLLVSRDKGASWGRETVTLGKSYRVYGRPALATRGNTLYVSATFINQLRGPDVLAVFQRDGVNAYRDIFSFADYQRFHEIGAMAVAANGDAYAVGRLEGFNQRGGAWTVETFANVGTLAMWDIAAGDGEYCAVGSYNDGVSGCKVFINP